MKEHSNESTECHACGETWPSEYLRPHGIAPSGRVLTWVCRACSGERQVFGARPHLRWPTVATAVMLAQRGYGVSADEVMRKALALLERQIEARKL